MVFKIINMNTRSLWDISQKSFLPILLYLACNSPKKMYAALSIRKSYEFEDLLQSSTESCRVDWYAQSRLGLTRTLSEENVYEDIIGKHTCYFSFIRQNNSAHTRNLGSNR